MSTPSSTARRLALAALMGLWPGGARADVSALKTLTPVMGWNSYNYYGCHPSEEILTMNTQGLLNMGFKQLGYDHVTMDCGWMANQRNAKGQLVWNATLFPSGGGAAIAQYLHNLGLKWGVYTGAGYHQCEGPDLPGSLGYEKIDADTFAAWGADSLKYDNCYSTSPDVMLDRNTTVATSPARFQNMSAALQSTKRKITFQICQWGVGTNLGTWAPPIGDSWRMSDDIHDNWASIYRITNGVVPYYKYTAVGAYPDMDMLEVGHGNLTLEQERFHFSMWAINKSPLIIGCPLNLSLTSNDSLTVLKNTEVIAINQDPLGQQTQLLRRYTEEGYDIWAGNLSNARMVVALANWKGTSTKVSLDFASVLGIRACSMRDIWAAVDMGTFSGVYANTLAGYQLQLLVLSDIEYAAPQHKSLGYHRAVDAELKGAAAIEACASASGQCAPVGSKVRWIGQGPDAAAVSFAFVTAAASSSGTTLMAVDYINYDTTITGTETNVRNMSIAVNGQKPKFWSFPISGGNWFDTGRLMVEVDGFHAGGDNTVVFTAYTPGQYGPDLVGIEVFGPAA